MVANVSECVSEERGGGRCGLVEPRVGLNIAPERLCAFAGRRYTGGDDRRGVVSLSISHSSRAALKVVGTSERGEAINNNVIIPAPTWVVGRQHVALRKNI